MHLKKLRIRLEIHSHHILMEIFRLSQISLDLRVIWNTMNEAIEQQAGMIDPRREILNMATEKQIELLNQKVTALTRENRELKKANEKLQKALRKQVKNIDRWLLSESILLFVKVYHGEKIIMRPYKKKYVLS